jgi:putative endonuclease
MWLSRKKKAPLSPGAEAVAAQAGAGAALPQPTTKTTKSRGDAAEGAARRFLQQAGLTFVEANFRTPGRGGGEIDLVMRARDATLVFVEVRHRAGTSHGGAGASIGALKQRRIIFAASHYLTRFGRPPPCRFDVVLVEGEDGQRIEWLQAAFDAS